MDFSEALLALKQGKKVARTGWNGKNMWIVLIPSLLEAQPYIAMWTAQQKWQPGWLASQADLLAEDWTVVTK